MLITLSRRSAICQSISEVKLTGVAPMGTVSHRLIFKFVINLRNELVLIYLGITLKNLRLL